MREMPVRDHLELWRGIDDAVWREAARAPVIALSGSALPVSVSIPVRAKPLLRRARDGVKPAVPALKTA